jgi:hypothetical protein
MLVARPVLGQFLLDHDIPEDLNHLLEELGHDVTPLRNVLPQETSDQPVADGSALSVTAEDRVSVAFAMITRRIKPVVYATKARRPTSEGDVKGDFACQSSSLRPTTMSSHIAVAKTNRRCHLVNSTALGAAAAG